MKEPISVIIVGAGHRALIYAEYALLHPEKMKVVGVADPNPVRRKLTMEKFGFGEDMCFENADQLASRGKLADAIINGTMDDQHVPTSIPLLKAGYHILLEKPFAVNEAEMSELVKVAKKYDRKVMICHVLRYTPFYKTIKEELLKGTIGKIINIQLNEHVSYHHTAVSYVRGKWASEKVCHAPMLLAKSCHDLDLLVWMMEGSAPVSISSYGDDIIFGSERKPADAGTRCLADCPIEKDCIYSARRNYLLPPYRWGFYAWDCLEGKNATLEDKEESLRTNNDYGKCVWDFQRDGNVAHQSVLFSFNTGATGTFNMIGNTAKSERNIHIIGSHGEIKGDFGSSLIKIITPSPENPEAYETRTIDVKVTGDMSGAHGGHGGGDLNIPADFVEYVANDNMSISCTPLETSVLSHLLVFRAEKSRKEGKMLSTTDFFNNL